MTQQTHPLAAWPTANAVQNSPFLTIENLSKVYLTAKGPCPVLENVNLNISALRTVYTIGSPTMMSPNGRHRLLVTYNSGVHHE